MFFCHSTSFFFFYLRWHQTDPPHFLTRLLSFFFFFSVPSLDRDQKKSLFPYPDSGGDLFFIIPRLRVLVPSKHTCTPPLFVVPLSIFPDIGRCCCCCCVATLPDKIPVQILISRGGCKVQMLLCCIKCIEQKHSAGQQLFSKKKIKRAFLPFFKSNIFKEVLHPEKKAKQQQWCHSERRGGKLPKSKKCLEKQALLFLSLSFFYASLLHS